jgi:perosamine synthetase
MSNKDNHNNKRIIEFIWSLYPKKNFVPLHEPIFPGNEKKYLSDCIDSTYVSSVGEYVGRFEKMVADFTGMKFAVATTNGTSALHASLILAGVKPGDEVITQALTFIATVNSIAYCGAMPLLIDSDTSTLGMCPVKLEEYLSLNCEVREDFCFNKKTGKRIKACVPMHVFGHPLKMQQITKITKKFNITIVEDAAEALGSYVDSTHVGHMGEMAILSFNGNKVITSGGGGIILTNNEELAKKAKHLTTTAKIPHAWEFVHDEVGYNYRLPNINAALACAQMEQLENFLHNKRETANLYKDFFAELCVPFIEEPKGCKSNYWLNAILLEDELKKQEFLRVTNNSGVMTRPLWTPINHLSMYAHCESTNLDVASDLFHRLVNIPSSVRIE